MPAELWFVYTLTDPITERVKYVGVTSQPNSRLVHHWHWRSNRKTDTSRWIEELASNGARPVMSIVDTCAYGERFSQESLWIAYYLKLGCDLTNHYTGRGTNNASPAMIAGYEKLRQASLARFANMSVEQLAEHGKSVKRGRSPESNDRIAAAKRNEWACMTPEQRRERTSKATEIRRHIDQHGTTHTEESKAKLKAAWARQTPEQRAAREAKRLETRRRNQNPP